VIAALFSIAFVAQAVSVTLPYLLAALGGAVCERAGVVDLALEGKLLAGAFLAAVVAGATGSILAGVIAGAVGGALVGALQATLALVWRADQVVIGIALNLVVSAVTRMLLQVVYGSAANSDPCPAIAGVIGDPIVWLALAALIAVPVMVTRTALGLRLRAAGDRPDALRAAGVSVARTRALAVVIGGALAGLGGAELSLKVGGFSSDMSAGRGYIALAAVILGGWRPLAAALAAAAFGVAKALTYQLMLHVGALPTELTGLFPYVLALAVLAIAPTRARPPAAIGRPDD
jgi:general nucleoside transport system permease protein